MTNLNVLFENGLPAKEIWFPKGYFLAQNTENHEQFIKVILEDSPICENIKNFILNKEVSKVYFLNNYSECWIDMENCYLLIKNIPLNLIKESDSMPVKITLYDNQENFLVSLE